MLRKSIYSCLFALVAIFQVVAIGKTAQAVAVPGPPTINKTTVIIRANTKSNWDYKLNKAVWGWAPEMDFRVNGPVPSGSVITVAFNTSDGKSWVSADCSTSTIAAGESFKVDRCGLELDRKAQNLSPMTGQFGVKIKLTNALQGIDQQLFNGKFKVSKVFYGDVPNDKDNYLWYVDYDWALPIAEVFPDAYEMLYAVQHVKDRQPLVASFWFRGDETGTVAYLFYKGQQIASTETTSDGIANSEQGVELWEKRDIYVGWRKNKYQFTHVLVKDTSSEASSDAFRLYKNPGEYEIKVLRKGKLARTVKFTVGADGKIADPGITRQNDLGTDRITLFANVSGDEDGRKPDLAAWKSSAFFGEPLKGFGN